MKYTNKNFKDWLTQFGSREDVLLECDYCDNTFTRNKHSIIRSINKGYTHSFCSSQCKSLYNGISIKKNCKTCDKEFTRNTKLNGTFCSQSCAASFNNLGTCKNPNGIGLDKARKSRIKNLKGSIGNKKYKPKRQYRPRLRTNKCINCENSASKNAKYCSTRCQMDYQLEARIASGEFSARTAKRYLLKHSGHICSMCDLSEWNNRPIPIEIDHINGNSSDNSLSNLRLLCPNCHAQTVTYKSRNKGNGRYYRRQRYKNGKSY